MKYLGAVLLVLLVALPLRAQQYVIEWTDTLDNGSDDYAEGVAVDGSGNVYVTGYYFNGSNYDYLTVKYDPSGNIVWTDTLDNGNTDRAYGIAVDGSGNVYVTGYSYNGSNNDYLTVKYDSLGNILWADTLDNGDYDEAYGITVDGDGNVYVTGRSYITNFDYLIVKYDSLGNILWADTLDNGDYDEAYGITVDGDGNVYVTGCSKIGSNDDYLTVKYDTSGNILREDTLDSGDNDHAQAIAVDGSGNVYVTGTSKIGSNFDYLTVKYDSLGNTIWADTLDNDSTDMAYGIAVDGSGNVYVTGYSWIGSNYDYLTVKYDSLGNLIWADTLDYSPNNRAFGIAVDGNSNIYVAGYSKIGSKSYDYLTVKYARYKDAGILSIVSPDTVGTDSSYTPQIWVKNNSYQDTLSFDIASYIDSTGGNMYTDTQSVSNLPVGDSVLVSFSQWTAPSDSMDLNLRFSIITGDMNADNDTISETLYVCAKYKDAGILSIVSPDTAGTDSSYTPQIWVKNNSYEDTLSFDIASYIDSIGGNLYADTQSVSNLPVGDSVLVSFSQWTAPSAPVDLNLSFSIITGDMNADNDAISKTLYVKDMSGILSKEINRRTILNVSTINKGSISFSYNTAKSGNYEINIYTIDGRIIKKIEGKGSGYRSERISGLPSGIYFLRLKQGKDVMNKKVVVIK